jgi:hypothetical protein
MQTTALSLALLGFILAGTAPSLYGNCRSCEVRSASHRDDLSQTGYYEDSPYFKSSQRQADNNESRTKPEAAAQTPQAPSQKNAVRKSREPRIRSSNVQQYVAPQSNATSIESSTNQVQPERSVQEELPNTDSIDVEIEEIQQN